MPIQRIAAIKRGPTSRNGNPSYWITFTDDTRALTSSDASCAYAIGNPDMREGCLVVVEYSPSGRITHLAHKMKTWRKTGDAERTTIAGSGT